MITIKPYGGLGNRLRSIDSAFALAECTQKNATIIWDANEELNCSFSELFEVPHNIGLKEISTSYLPRKINEKFSMVMHKLNINYPFGYDKILHEEDVYSMKQQNYDFCKLKKSGKIYIYINGRFLFPEKPYHYLKPVKNIQDKVESLSGVFSPGTVGVHIRRTDNKLAIKESPLQNFVELMKKENAENRNIKFYLSTDSPEAENYVKRSFPNQVVSYKKELSRNKMQGVKDALIDMLCLSRTSKIIGSYYSSFSEVASEMGKIPLVIARTN